MCQVYVLSFVREIVSHQRLNGCQVDAMSAMLSVSLCHKSADSPLSPIMPITCSNIVSHLLTCSDFAKLPADNSEHQQVVVAASASVGGGGRGGNGAGGPRGRYGDIQ